MERFSISISKEMKKQLEQMAKDNFRKLNGEINKALDDYIKRNGASVVIDEPKIEYFEPQFEQIEPKTHQITPPIPQNEPIRTTLINNNEIEEF